MPQRFVHLQQWEVPPILDGRKTQLRRLVKPQPTGKIPPHWGQIDSHGWWSCANNTGERWKSPFGQPGDLLCFKETWAEATNVCDQQPWPDRPHCAAKYDAVVIYRADGEITWCDGDGWEEQKSYWRSPVTMPSWSVRLFGRVKRVWVERVQDITEEDCIKFGARELPLQENKPGAWWSVDPTNPSLHASFPRAAVGKFFNLVYKDAWERNDWVWACEFELEKKI